ncbi:MAG: oligosaccharide flippase family protein [Pseudomonadota bacterium]
MLRGAGWGLLMRWGNRFIGIFNLMIIARLLTPTEIGVVALATLLSSLILQFYEIGIAMLLIRKQDIDSSDCNTAWTMRMVLAVILGGVMLLLAPTAAGYFDEPRMIDVIYVIALSFVISSGANVGMILARRELDFAKDFRYNIYSRFLTFLITVALALWLRNAWAIVFGTLFGTILTVILSFRMHPYRPRIDFSKYKEYLVFGLSIVPINIGQYLLKKIAPWIVGGVATTNQFVAYNMGSDLAGVFTEQVVGSIGRGQFPNYSRILDKPKLLATAFSHELTVVAGLILPLAVGLAVVAGDAVPVLLGDQWDHMVPLLPWLSIYSALAALLTLLTGQILIATSHERLSASLLWARLAILAPMAYFAGQAAGAEGVAKAVVAATVLAIPLAIVALTWSKVISLLQILRALWRPVIAVLIMAVAISYLHVADVKLAIVRLALDAAVGGTVYFGAVVLLWLIAGRPEGPESAIVGKLTKAKVGAAE